MNQIDIYKDGILKKISGNFPLMEKYFTHHLNEMCALNSIKYEVLNCLVLELYHSSITATNHLLERMLKLSLIELETKNVNYSEIEKYTRIVNHAHEQYDHLYIHQTLKHNKNKKLISEDEFNYLSQVSKTMRDGYSHAQTSVINKEMPKTFTGFSFSISEVKSSLTKGDQLKAGAQIDIPSSSPTISQLFQDNVSKDKALLYFENVYIIIMNIETRISNIN